MRLKDKREYELGQEAAKSYVEYFEERRDDRRNEVLGQRWQAVKKFWMDTGRAHHRLLDLNDAFISARAYPPVQLATFHRVLCQNYGMDPTTYDLTWLFRVFDYDHLDAVDYREFICMLRLLEKPAETTSVMITCWYDIFNTFLLGISPESLVTVLSITARSKSEMDYMEDLVGREAPSARRPMGRQQFIYFLLAHPEITEHIGRQRKDIEPPPFHCARFVRSMDQSEAAIQYIVRKHQFRRAATHWALREPRIRFRQWKLFMLHKRKLRRGNTYFALLAYGRGLRKLRARASMRKERRRQLSRAVKHYDWVLRCRLLYAWRRWKDEQLQHTRRYLALAGRFYDVKMLRKMWSAYAKFTKEEVKRNKQKLRQAVHKWERLQMAKLLELWRDNAGKQRAEREAEEVQRMLFASLADAEQEYADNIRRQEEAAAKAIEDARLAEEAQKAYEEEMEKKANLLLNRRLLKKQEAERAAHKQAQWLAFVAERERFWEGMMSQALGDAKTAAEEWVDSEDGAQLLAEEATWLFEEDPQEAVGRARRTQGVEFSDWQLLLDTDEGDGIFAKAFYFSAKTSEKVYAKDLKLKNCMSIARANIIAAKQVEMRNELKLEQQRDFERELSVLMARKIQGAFRSKRSLRFMRQMVRNVVIRRIDPVSGGAYYYNLQSHEKSWQKPLLLGDEQDIDYFESDTWNLRTDANGVNYYENMQNQDITQAPPPAFITCRKCQAALVTRRCNNDGMRYCLDCFVDVTEDSLEHKKHTWSKIPVQAARCIVCKQLATTVCVDCKDDAYCDSCFEIVHTKRKHAFHREFYPLTRADE